jgi:nicotinamidase-related amidase
LLGPEARLLCAAYGILVPEDGIAPLPPTRRPWRGGFGWPVALKVLSPDVLHKSEAGGVSVDLRSDADPEDIVVTKKRVSALAGSDLEILLRALEVDALVLSGIATSGVVLSTVRQAADLDYRLTVLRDGCADADPEVHRVLLEKVFPRQAEVLRTDDWVNRLPSATSTP